MEETSISTLIGILISAVVILLVKFAVKLVGSLLVKETN